MKRNELLEMFAERGLLLSPEALDYVEKEAAAGDDVRKILSVADLKSPAIIGIDRVQTLFQRKIVMNTGEKTDANADPSSPSISAAREISYAVPPQDIRVLLDVTGQSRSTAKVESFVATFQDRYRKIRSMFRGDVRVKGVIDIASMPNPKLHGTEASIIGMITDFHDSPKGVVASIEDMSGSARVFFREKDLSEKLIVDEVIAIRGKIVRPKGKNGISMFASKVYWPDIPLHDANRSEEPVSAAFISDVHIGSNTFLRDSWNDFLNWLSSEDPLAKRIGYIVMAGDVVDGVGIYPGQEDDLEITDIYSQYEALARDVERIPERIKVIISPGNHDFVRPAEPQPAFGNDIRSLFKREVEFIGSPSLIEICGVKVLVYHGTSINDFISRLPGVSYEDPSKALKRMLKSRILAPAYGGSTPLAPEQSDYTVIEDVPDIFVTGHVHSYVRFNYRGITVINASTWQSQTEYQKMNNFKPVPGVVTVVDLDSGTVWEKRFYS